MGYWRHKVLHSLQAAAHVVGSIKAMSPSDTTFSKLLFLCSLLVNEEACFFCVACLLMRKPEPQKVEKEPTAGPRNPVPASMQKYSSRKSSTEVHRVAWCHCIFLYLRRTIFTLRRIISGSYLGVVAVSSKPRLHPYIHSFRTLFKASCNAALCAKPPQQRSSLGTASTLQSRN